MNIKLSHLSHITRQRISLTLLLIASVIIFTRFQYAYGSSLDWCSQHIVFPDYFRKLFYETGDLFPDFAPNIGGGQNIYYFSYYGLFSPIVLLSYLFPFLEMSTYMQIVSILGVWASVMLFHRFLLKRFGNFSAYVGALCLLLSTPLLFHSHRHIMFVSYMPFLILSMEQAENFIKTGKKTLLIVFVSLMILCSYYFAVTALMSVTAYGVFAYLKHNSPFKLKHFLLTALKFALCIVISLMICAILLLPTFSAITQGRELTETTFDPTMLIPRLILGISGLSPHAIGLSVFGILSVTSAVMCHDKAKRFLGIFIAAVNIFPIFTLTLNGGMYLDGKVLIPFVPLLTYLIAAKLEDYDRKLPTNKSVYIVSAAVLLSSVIFYQIKYDVVPYFTVVTVLADIAVFMVFFAIYLRQKIKACLAIGVTAISAVVMIGAGFTEYTITPETMEYEKSDEILGMTEDISRDSKLWRSALCAYKADTVNMIYNTDFYTSNVYSSLCSKPYKNFYFNLIRNENEYRNSALITRSSNMLYNIFMGNKYLITNKPEAETGYELIRQEEQFGFYKDDNVLPIGRSSNMLISTEYFDSLSPVEQMEALVKYIVVPDNSIKNTASFTHTPYKLPSLPENSSITQTQNGFTVHSNDKFELDLSLTAPVPKDKLLIIFMNIDNSDSNDDSRIKINSMRNTLTNSTWKYCNKNYNFEYVISTDGKDELDNLHFIFSNGDYSVSNIESYLIDYPENISLTGEMEFDKAQTKGDFLQGSIDCTDDGYFELAVPYESGFEVTVDGENTDVKCVDKGFVGFEIQKGKHTIQAEYHAPKKRPGLILSAAGIIVLIAIGVYENIIIPERRKANDRKGKNAKRNAL